MAHFGDEAEFMCDYGYELRGLNKRKCNDVPGSDIGRWSAFTPFCLRKYETHFVYVIDEK